MPPRTGTGPCAALRNVRHARQQQRQVLLVGRVLAGEPGRPKAGAAAQRVDLDPRVVGHSRDAPVTRATAIAFSSAFSRYVSPVSSMSGHSAALGRDRLPDRPVGADPRISPILPAFLVARASFGAAPRHRGYGLGERLALELDQALDPAARPRHQLVQLRAR